MEPIRAIVQKVITNGRHGPYAFAVSEGINALKITFSLAEDVWKESEMPEEGMFVVLSQLRKKRGGWRAHRARFLTPADEQVPTSQPSKEH